MCIKRRRNRKKESDLEIKSEGGAWTVEEWGTKR